jgi:hypothetical protein
MDLVLVLAAGRADRFGGLDKCSIAVEGESLVARTTRLCHERLSVPVKVVVAEGRSYTDDEHLVAAPAACDVDRFVAGQEQWPSIGEVGILYGDVWFSEAALDAFVWPRKAPVVWYGRRRPSYITGKPYGEIFAVRFQVPGPFLMGVEAVRTGYLNRQLARCLGWEVEDHLRRQKVGEFVTIDDLTEDFDYPVDLERWQRLSGKPCVLPG